MLFRKYTNYDPQTCIKWQAKTTPVEVPFRHQGATNGLNKFGPKRIIVNFASRPACFFASRRTYARHPGGDPVPLIYDS